MKKQLELKKLVFQLVILCHFVMFFGQLAQELGEIDFKKEVEKFCMYKEAVNFCSAEHLQIMFEIDTQRRQALEMKRQISRMKDEIFHKVFKNKPIKCFH